MFHSNGFHFVLTPMKGLSITLLCAISLIAVIYQIWSGEPPTGKLGCVVWRSFVAFCIV